MGMFDYVDYKCECPSCGGHVDGFQSKDGKCELAFLKPYDVEAMHSMCDACGKWIEIKTKDVMTVDSFVAEFKALLEKYSAVIQYDDQGIKVNTKYGDVVFQDDCEQSLCCDDI